MPEWCEMPLPQGAELDFHTVRNNCPSGGLKTKTHSPKTGENKNKKVPFYDLGY